MGSKPDALSIPPDTGDIDTDWSETSSVIDSEGGDTAIPPGPYEQYAKHLTSGRVTDAEARNALSAPALPVLDASILDELMERCSRDSGEMEAPAPVIGQQASGPYAIPLELGDDGDGPRPGEFPTTPQLEPPPELMATIPTPKAPPDSGDWRKEASSTPLVTEKGVLDSLHESSPRRKPIRRSNVPVEEPEVSVTIGEPEYLELDEPGGIGMEDSLEISLDVIPPAPFDPSCPLSPMKIAGKPLLRRESSDGSLALSLESGGDALDLVHARATPMVPDPSDPLVDLRDRYAVGDFTGAHEIAEAILQEQPDNVEALRFRESCRDVLMQMYQARLGTLTSVPRLAIPSEELQWLSLDHRTGFLLSCVDGRSTVEEILDVSGMPALDALRILFTLLQQRIIQMG